MPTWNSRGLRGSTLEEFINRTNERYRENHLALIQNCLLYTSFQAVDKCVLYLKRLSMGSLHLDQELAPGAWRELTPEEISNLKEEAK